MKVRLKSLMTAKHLKDLVLIVTTLNLYLGRNCLSFTAWIPKLNIKQKLISPLKYLPTTKVIYHFNTRQQKAMIPKKFKLVKC
jgi:hypothetical protein